MNVGYLCSKLCELGYDRWVEHFVGLWKAQVSSDELSDIMMMQIGEDRVWSMMVQDCRAASSLFLSLVKGMLPHAGAKGTLRYLSDIINGRCIAISPNIKELFDVEKFIRELQIGYDARMLWSSLQDEEDDSMDDDEEDSDDDDPADDAEDDSTDDDEEDLDDDDTADDAEDEHAPNEDEENVWNALLALGRGMHAARERARGSSPRSGRARGSSPPSPPSIRFETVTITLRLVPVNFANPNDEATSIESPLADRTWLTSGSNRKRS